MIKDYWVMAKDQSTLMSSMVAVGALLPSGEMGYSPSPAVAYFSYFGDMASSKTGIPYSGKMALVGLDDASTPANQVLGAMQSLIVPTDATPYRRPVYLDTPTSTNYEARITAVEQNLPSASDMVPPGVALNSAPGAYSGKYARPDHTHASSIQTARLAVPTTGIVPWTFPKAYPALQADGVTVADKPLAFGIVEVPSGTQMPYEVNLVGQPGYTSCLFQVWKSQSTTLGGVLAGIVGAVINPFTQTLPTGIFINVYSRLPTRT